MKERPILFQTEMVKAILADRKSQTRRVIKPQLPRGGDKLQVQESSRAIEHCPYGRVGDRLWVRETWAAVCQNEYGQVLQWRDVAKENRKEERCMTIYKADETELNSEYEGSWIPSIFMPRWASRLTLEITDVRAQRIQEISEYDAEQEGVQVSHYYCDEGEFPAHRCDPVGKFKELWDSINGRRPGCSWQENPWVWCLSFKVI
jgi:hypothetical protein